MNHDYFKNELGQLLRIITLCYEYYLHLCTINK